GPEPMDESSANYASLRAGAKDHIIESFEAWMPERIAAVKLRGFVEDFGGRIIESIPGLIRVRLGELHPADPKKRSFLGWLLSPSAAPTPRQPGDRAPPIAMDLYMTKKDDARSSKPELTVVFRAISGPLPTDRRWHDRCKRLMTELKGYVMAQG